jgi:hypothetical protein
MQAQQTHLDSATNHAASSTSADARIPYLSPTLVRLGQIEDITRGSGGSLSDKNKTPKT